MINRTVLRCPATHRPRFRADIGTLSPAFIGGRLPGGYRVTPYRLLLMLTTPFYQASATAAFIE
jgi:hypothetical protein